MLPLTEQSWGLLRTELGIESQVEWVKHLLNLHDGEVRFVGEPWWADMNGRASGGSLQSLYSPRLWHSQTLRTPQAREWAY